MHQSDLHRPSNARMAHNEKLVKQKKALDVALLCSKLEAYRREQDVIRSRREKRHAVQNGSFVPRTASKQITAFATQVATSQEAPAIKRRHQSVPFREAPKQILSRPQTDAQLDAPHRVNVTSIIGNQVVSKGEKQEKRDSSGPLAKEMMAAGKTNDSPSPTRRPRSTAPVKERSQSVRRASSRSDKNHSDWETASGDDGERPRSKERKVKEYRPGDAAKRRSDIFECTFPRPTGRDGALGFSNFHDLRIGRLEHDKQIPSILEEWESKPATMSAPRPRLASHDRPNWCQQSQNGSIHSAHEPPRHAIHIFPQTRQKPPIDAARKARAHPRPQSTMGLENRAASFMQVPAEPPDVMEGHLVADAVKIIKKQEKVQKRRSMLSLGLFKK